MKENILEVIGTDYTQSLQMFNKLKVQAECFVGWVDSDNGNGTINVQPAIQNKIIDENNAVRLKNKPFLINVWVVANMNTRPIKRGDKALILVLDEKSNNFFKAQFDETLSLEKQTIVNNSRDLKSINNCVAIIIGEESVENTFYPINSIRLFSENNEVDHTHDFGQTWEKQTDLSANIQVWKRIE